MTLLCHRVDLFDDFTPGRGNRGASYAEDLVVIRCLGEDRGCACRTPCNFCHTVVEDYDEPAAGEGGDEISPNLAFLFKGNGGAKKPPTPEVKKEKEDITTTISSTLVVDKIFAQNHGLLSENVDGGVKVKKYHHPPVGKYNFTPPLMELPKFFEDNNNSQHLNNGYAESAAHCNGNNGHHDEPKKEEDNGAGGLDSFFDDFKLASKSVPDAQQKEARPQQQQNNNDNDERILVFRTPLKTVVKKTIASNNSGWSGKCLCQCRYENLVKGSTLQNPHDPSLDKYWAQRHRLFKRFDEGIQLDGEGWYSVTPEVVADHVASRFADASDQLMQGSRNKGGRNKKSSQAMVVLDAFCGCGGNAIAFAKLLSSKVSLVISMDIDRPRLRMAAHNASIYGIPPNRIVFVEANSVAAMERCYRDGNLIMDPPPRTPDALAAYPPREIYEDFTIGGIDLLAEYGQHIDAVFMDPPWGGMDYGAMGKDGYDLSRDMKIRGCERGCVGFPPTPEVNGVHLLKIAAAATSTRFVAYDLPRNANKRSIAAAALEAGYEGNSKLEEHYLNGRLKTVTAYFGQDFRYLLDLKKYHKGTEGN